MVLFSINNQNSGHVSLLGCYPRLMYTVRYQALSHKQRYLVEPDLQEMLF